MGNIFYHRVHFQILTREIFFGPMFSDSSVYYNNLNNVQNTVILCPVIQCSFNHERRICYCNPGYLSLGGDFISCSIATSHVLLNNFHYDINGTKREYGESPREQLTLNLSSYKDKIIDAKPFPVMMAHGSNAYEREGLSYPLKFIENTICFIDKYFSKNGNVDGIDAANFSYDTFFLPNRIIILDAINALEIQHYENSMNVVGKDNVFWDEYEIKNLPKWGLKYLKVPIVQILSSVYERVISIEEGLLIKGDSQSAWSPSFGRVNTGNGGTYIKTLLAFEFSKRMDDYEIINYKVGKQSALK